MNRDLLRQALETIKPQPWPADPCVAPTFLQRLWATYSFLHGDAFGSFFGPATEGWYRPSLVVPGIITDTYEIVSVFQLACSGECLFAHTHLPLREPPTIAEKA